MTRRPRGGASVRERPRFGGVTPLGQGTPYVESLTGYLQRLANTYEIPTATLFGRAVYPALQARGLWRSRLSDVLRRHAYALNGADEVARLGVDRLETLAGRNDLADCSFLTLGDLELIRRAEVVADGKRWCPACWRADGPPGGRYERKLWALAVVEACPVHGTALTERCFACGRRQPVIARDVGVGTCGLCGADLAGPVEPSTPRDGSDATRQAWYAGEAAALLAAVHVSGLLGFDAARLAAARRRGLADLLERSGRVGAHPAAVQRVERWQRRWGRPNLEEVFSVLWRARWPIAGLFPGAVQRALASRPVGAGECR